MIKLNSRIGETFISNISQAIYNYKVEITD